MSCTSSHWHHFSTLACCSSVSPPSEDTCFFAIIIILARASSILFVRGLIVLDEKVPFRNSKSKSLHLNLCLSALTGWTSWSDTSWPWLSVFRLGSAKKCLRGNRAHCKERHWQADCTVSLLAFWFETFPLRASLHLSREYILLLLCLMFLNNFLFLVE